MVVKRDLVYYWKQPFAENLEASRRCGGMSLSHRLRLMIRGFQKSRPVIMRKLSEAVRGVARGLRHGWRNIRSLSTAVVRKIFNQTLRLPGRHMKAQQRLQKLLLWRIDKPHRLPECR